MLFSNVGKLNIPPEMEPHVKRLDFLAGPGKINGVRVGCGSIKNVLTVSFLDICEETEIERRFFTTLVKAGIPVKIESNR